PIDAMDTRPWNADLLDYLATYLADHNYDLQRVLRLIATSRAYQSSTAIVDEGDVTEEYRYQGPIAKRMTAEQFVDAVWQITGAGPKKPHGKAAEFLSLSGDQASTAGKRYRASLVASDLLMRSLGRPNREQVVTSRPPLLTTLQALDLSNSPTLVQTISEGAARHFADSSGQEGRDAVEAIYLAALSRAPTDDEREIATQILGDPSTKEGIEDLLWAVFMLPEFQIVR
ncbi:MAG: DUF1553 domain-containing protein, partial [Planctomycetota bacterium]